MTFSPEPPMPPIEPQVELQIEPPLFACPFCKSEIQLKNVAKHFHRMHSDTSTIHKYVSCALCKGLFLKHKLTPHMRKEHGCSPSHKKKKQTKKKK